MSLIDYAFLQWDQIQSWFFPLSLSDLDCHDGLRVLPGLLLYDQPQLRGSVRSEGHHEAEQQGMQGEQLALQAGLSSVDLEILLAGLANFV